MRLWTHLVSQCLITIHFSATLRRCTFPSFVLWFKGIIATQLRSLYTNSLNSAMVKLSYDNAIVRNGQPRAENCDLEAKILASWRKPGPSHSPPRWAFPHMCNFPGSMRPTSHYGICCHYLLWCPWPCLLHILVLFTLHCLGSGPFLSL